VPERAYSRATSKTGLSRGWQPRALASPSAWSTRNRVSGFESLLRLRKALRSAAFVAAPAVEVWLALFLSTPGGGAVRHSASGCARGSQQRNLKEASCPKFFSMPPVDRDRRPHCPACTPAAHRVTRASATRRLNVVLWRAGLRIHEPLALGEADLDSRRGWLLVRRGKGGRRREVGMDE
jgi:hypothetical protein